ncbi:hypothetical protein [Actinoallomurus sp. CA-142502]|uniref:hypothetical protein n=1 Tax=Actinoallomurus sp. CA-142502 TaxID=3239885 RepID=UPI003D89B3D1
MTDQALDGYTVETAGLRDFRDGTLTNVAESLPGLHQAIAAAGLSADAFPAVVADAAKNRDVALDGLHDVVQGARRHVDGHIDDMDTAMAGYGQAEWRSWLASQPGVAADPPSSPPGTPPQPTGQTLDTTAATTVTSSDSTSAEDIFRLYQSLQKAANLVGLGHLVQPIGALLRSNVRDPGQYLQAADRLDGVTRTANRLHSATLDGLERLGDSWSGRASDGHQAWTQATYHQLLGDIQTQAKNQSAMDRNNAETIQAFNCHTRKVIGIAIAATFALLVFAPFFVAGVLSLWEAEQYLWAATVVLAALIALIYLVKWLSNVWQSNPCPAPEYG